MVLHGIDSTGVVSLGVCVAVQSWATVFAKSSANGGSSGQGPLRGSNSLASSLMRLMCTVPYEVLS